MIHHNISLRKYNTFGLDYNALSLIIIKNEEEAIKVLDLKTDPICPTASQNAVPVFKYGLLTRRPAGWGPGW